MGRTDPSALVFLVLIFRLSSTTDRGPRRACDLKIEIVPTISQTSLDAPETTWQPPECPFAIEWSAAVLDEIRLAVVEAFFSLPHGGAEIGGVLFGTRTGGCVRILAFRPLECEHALGPTFTLSEKDHARLRTLLEDPGPELRAQGLEPVGWYHSHTRSEILLSAQDVALHNRHFPDPWQVALVMRPHALKPVRAGFFFREAGGYIHVDSSYQEFLLQPAAGIPSRPVEPQARPEPPRAEMPQPAFVAHTPRRRSWRWIRWSAIPVALAAGLFAFKQDWMPDRVHRARPSLSLITYDLEGQVQIHWDGAAEPIRAAAAGALSITDGAASTVVPLDKGQLQSGTFSYARQSARVDVRLAVDQPGGKKFSESASFLGRAPAGKQASDASAETETLRKEVHDQAARTRRMERVISDMRAQIRREQERRRNESPQQPNP